MLGCNSAFEGVHQLDKLIAKASLAPSAMSPSSPSVLAHGVVGDAPSTSPPPVLGRAFKEFFDLYKANGDAIAAMAVENYYEMMDKTASPVFLLKKAVEIRLSQSFPGAYLSRYAMVTHTLIPYSVCFEAGKIQQEIIDSLCTTITSAEQVDMKRAKHMIDTKLTPFLHSHGIASHDFHDNSWDIMNRHRSGSASTTHTVSTLKAKL